MLKYDNKHDLTVIVSITTTTNVTRNNNDLPASNLSRTSTIYEVTLHQISF